jgi:hypothetical protein
MHVMGQYRHAEMSYRRLLAICSHCVGDGMCTGFAGNISTVVARELYARLMSKRKKHEERWGVPPLPPHAATDDAASFDSIQSSCNSIDCPVRYKRAFNHEHFVAASHKMHTFMLAAQKYNW